MAAPSVRGVGAFGSGTTSFTAAVPTGGSAPVAGDAMYIVMESSDSSTAAGTPATPGGWTSLYEQTVGGGATNVTTLTVFGKIAGAGEANVTVSGVGDHCAGAMIVVQDHGLAAITDTVVGAQSNHGTTTTGCSTSGITVLAASFIILAIGFTDDANDTTNHSGWSNANLANGAERIDQTVATNAGGGVGIWTATCAGTTTGATTWNHDTAANSQSVHLGIKPNVEGTSSQTLGGATLAGTGAVAVSATGAVTLAGATLAGTGTVAVSGTLAQTLAGVTLVGTGTVTGGGVTGTLAVTLGGATLAGTGAVPVSGALAVTLDGVALAATGAVGVVGALSVALDSLPLAGAGAVSATGSFAVVLDGAALSATGEVTTTPVSGTLAVTLDGVAAAGTGHPGYLYLTGTVRTNNYVPLVGGHIMVFVTSTLTLAGEDTTDGAGEYAVLVQENVEHFVVVQGDGYAGVTDDAVIA